MARIKNMGTATMKFGEGIIVTGSAGEDSPALVISGTSVIKSNVSGDYSLLVDNDQSNQGHGLKVSSDGTGTGTNVFDVESGATNLFRVRADGRVGIGKENPGAKLDVNGNAIVSGSLYVNLEGDGESLKIVGTLDHENFIVFEQPAGSNRAYLGLDAGDNLDVVNMSNNDDINFYTTHGDTKATMVLTANNRVGVGKFGWAGKTEYGMNEAFPRDELDVSGSMRVSENVELMGSELVVSGTITGRYDSAIPGNALMFKNTEVYFVTTDDDVANKTMAPDENIFFSGSIGSRGTSTKGTAVFGGDMVVSGALRVSDAFTLPSSDGTNDQVLTTNGNGQLSWSNQSSGGGGGGSSGPLVREVTFPIVDLDLATDGINHDVYAVGCNQGNRIVTLPAPSTSHRGKQITFIKNAGPNTLTITAGTGNIFDQGAATTNYVISGHLRNVTLVCLDYGWIVIAEA